MGIDPYAVRLIRWKARQLAGTAGFTESDREDIEQELTLDFLKRLPHHDPARSTLEAFAAGVVDHKVASIIERRQAQKRDWRRVGPSLNDAVHAGDDGARELGDSIPAADGPDADLAIDLAEALAALPPELRDLCERLSRWTVTEVARQEGVSRRTIHRRMAEIRRRFVESGLEPLL
jgi:RNA polymerase sigma-70 factor (ECF subfamily)